MAQPNPTLYVVRKNDGFVTLPFEEYENVAENLEKATPVPAADIIRAVSDTDISLVHDSDPDEWCVSHIHGRDLTLEDLEDCK